MFRKFWLQIFHNKAIFGVLLLSFGLLVGFFFNQIISSQNNNCVSVFKFINPDLDCELSNRKAESMDALQAKLGVLITSYKNTGKVDRVGVFARDLKSTRFVGVNENDIFYMASLLKLPLLVGGYKLAEVEPKILEEEVAYTGTPNLYGDQYIKPEEVLEAGKTYTVRELMRRAVVDSDNTAAQLLFNFYPSEFLDRIVQALGIKLKRQNGETENPISARTYANVFRMLYNASYLTREYSDEALSVLTQTSYRNGAVAHLPQSVQVAHKFAERTVVDPATNTVLFRQLHECGIVYAQKGKEPYTFCIMTEGKNYDDLEKVLQDISKEIYDALTSGSGD